MQLGYTIIYVPDVEKAAAFYEKTFGLKRKFLDESGKYAEMDTGATTLSVAADDLAQSHFSTSFARNEPAKPPAGIEIAFTTPDVPAAFSKAVSAGASPLAEPTEKPWGQVAAYVRDLNGVLIEICTPMG